MSSKAYKACHYEWVQWDCHGHVASVLLLRITARDSYRNATAVLQERYGSVTALLGNAGILRERYGIIFGLRRKYYGNAMALLRQ